MKGGGQLRLRLLRRYAPIVTPSGTKRISIGTTKSYTLFVARFSIREPGKNQGLRKGSFGDTLFVIPWLNTPPAAESSSPTCLPR